MPLPEHEDKHDADGFLKKLCPIFGEIRRVEEPQGYYRIHPPTTAVVAVRDSSYNAD